ncbi:ATP synthase F1 subunit delta [Mycoplasma sp. U97]|uniref:ATP synthase F1 subunit delta n=1 Tax=Mycoplasma tauri TaxID=547987 RepID=UPI001CC08DF9|nr:ATP synthase F1 subunit delta [Mycoplasma tauri]MBZ4212445.1 ATP synthase F1 subunit delta [Mycoplasma tauri]
MYTKANPDGYALALYDLIKEEKNIEKTYDTIASFYNLVKENIDVINFLKSFKVSQYDKFKIIDEFALNDDKLKTFSTFLKVVTKNNYAGALIRILSIYLKIVEKELGIIRANIITAFEIEEKILEKIKLKLEKNLSKKVILKTYLDKSLISGFRIEFNNKIIEQNIKKDLEKIGLLMKKNKGGLNG